MNNPTYLAAILILVTAIDQARQGRLEVEIDKELGSTRLAHYDMTHLLSRPVKARDFMRALEPRGGPPMKLCGGAESAEGLCQAVRPLSVSFLFVCLQYHHNCVSEQQQVASRHYVLCYVFAASSGRGTMPQISRTAGATPSNHSGSRGAYAPTRYPAFPAHAVCVGIH